MREVSLRDLILHARTYSRIDDPSPLVTVALRRLTLALLHRGLREPLSTTQAAEWFAQGFSEGTLETQVGMGRSVGMVSRGIVGGT
ncbi:type I-E CRISPR-associated protein Cse1/CasA [Deinococcus sp. LM3]|uniref:type I-E CRISPR-associated protein Cse1/CasA n=1 Tax=Deinococcus sp. LM3 TaxID=1938608 RepID=UPI0009CF045A|nr:type I-E CRISPR-associated protein Cse1/CasA [Deinococcus sp. LM3]OOV11344.1 hypothetical protein BXU09_19960 [Deinococcus sp. LM3]